MKVTISKRRMKDALVVSPGSFMQTNMETDDVFFTVANGSQRNIFVKGGR